MMTTYEGVFRRNMVYFKSPRRPADLRGMAELVIFVGQLGRLAFPIGIWGEREVPGIYDAKCWRRIPMRVRP